MEVYILGNSSSPLPSVVSPITVPAYQASEAVIPLASGSSPIGIGSGSRTSTIAINEQSISNVFSILMQLQPNSIDISYYRNY